MDKTIKQTQQEIEQFLKDRGWFPHNREGRYYTLSHMMEELGEVARCITLIESRRGNWLENIEEKQHEQLTKELGDVFFHVLKMASAYGICAQDAIEKALAKNHTKFPTEKFKDFGQHDK